MKLICFSHPDYDGKTSPVLSCKTCCSLFLGELKRRQSEKGETPASQTTEEWLEDKAKTARESAPNSTAKFGFDPRSI